jgi:hypothetical protein
MSRVREHSAALVQFIGNTAQFQCSSFGGSALVCLGLRIRLSPRKFAVELLWIGQLRTTIKSSVGELQRKHRGWHFPNEP